MSDQKTEAVEHAHTPAPPIQEAAAPTPTRAAPPQPAARAAATLAAPAAGAPQRARAGAELQQSVGNARTSELLAEAPAAAPGSTVQRKQKQPAPKKPPPISTPLPDDAERKPAGNAELRIGDVKVVVLPDKRAVKPIIAKGKRRDAMTNIQLSWQLPGARTRGNEVIAIDAVSPPTLSIQTIYGPGASSEMKSGYGKGTTPEDIRAGKTTLGYHEGSHGAYAIEYTRKNPLPKFGGKVGMSVAEFNAATDEYDKALQGYTQALLEHQGKMTDCVGTPMEGCE